MHVNCKGYDKMKCPNCKSTNIKKLRKYDLEIKNYKEQTYCDDCKFLIKDWS